MKVLAACMRTESNAHIPMKNTLADYDLAVQDQKVIDKMLIGDIFEKEKIELIPAVFAASGPSGVIERNAFDYIESCVLNTVKKHIHELDGVLLFLHGASEVDGLGSGEHHLLQKIRELTGPYLPVAIACDPHGNLCREYVEGATILRSYRESPHTDMEATYRLVARMLCDLLKQPKSIVPVYRKLPLILGGEQSVSADEPVRSINRYMDELEQDPRLLSVSWHVGYIRHDTDVAGCGVVVVPADNQYRDYAEKIADQLAEFIWQRRHEFHYTGLTAQPDEALRMALECKGKPAFITDSGDNVTSGATGWNTLILRQVLAQEKLEKRVLFASICDPRTCRELADKPVGSACTIRLGMEYDELSKAVELEVTVLHHGDVLMPVGYNAGQYTKFGRCVSVAVKDRPVTIVIADVRQTYALHDQFIAAGVDWDAYDVIIVKQGYIFPELKAKAAFSVMSLAEGATLQDTRRLTFKRIQRPMYPLDEI